MLKVSSCLDRYYGALIHNLNNLDADLVFVKNIDNVTTEERLQPTIDYKKYVQEWRCS